MILLESIGPAFLIGFFGSAHCFGMCGGISSALTFALSGDAKTRKFQIVFSYNFGRILSYALIGLLAALLGGFISGISTPFPIMRTIAAVLLILMGFYLSGWWRILTKLELLGQLLWRHISPIGQRFMPVKNLRQAFILGMLWGWLPCGLVYTALAFAATQSNALYGALVMLAFGFGTLPALIASGLASAQLKSWLQNKQILSVMGILLILFGVWTLHGAYSHAQHVGHASNSEQLEDHSSHHGHH